MNKWLTLGVAALFVSGCASVPMESKEVSAVAKSFKQPAAGKAGLYVYRDGSLGAALKKDVWVDGKCMGETAPNVFFFQEVDGEQEHKVSTESEFSPNDLIVKTESGRNYFVEQYIKLGVFVGGAGVRLIDESVGKKVVSGLEMAKGGRCSK